MKSLIFEAKIPPHTTRTIRVISPCIFRGTKIIVDANCLEDFWVRMIRIGKKDQIPLTTNGINTICLSKNTLNNEFLFDDAKKGTHIELLIYNDHNRTRKFRCNMVGESPK